MQDDLDVKKKRRAISIQFSYAALAAALVAALAAALCWRRQSTRVRLD